MHEPDDKFSIPDEPGDYAVMVGFEVVVGRLTHGLTGDHIFYEISVDGEWEWDHSFSTDAYDGPWARFPDGTFPAFPDRGQRDGD